MDWTLEVVVLPVSSLDRAIEFYRDQVGFDLDHHTINEHMNVAQLTPRGSGCSIVIGDLPSQSEMAPGSMRGPAAGGRRCRAAREELVGRGVEAGDITVFDERDGGTFFGFSDPDGNTWSVQELKVRADKPLIPARPVAGSGNNRTSGRDRPCAARSPRAGGDLAAKPRRRPKPGSEPTPTSEPALQHGPQPAPQVIDVPGTGYKVEGHIADASQRHHSAGGNGSGAVPVPDRCRHWPKPIRVRASSRCRTARRK